MKKLLAPVLIFAAALCLDAAERLYGGLSYSQRGILETGGNEMPVSIFVRSFGGRTAMQMESQIGMLCRMEIDPEGRPMLLETSPIFRESWARKYVLRDFRRILGMDPGPASSNYSVKYSKYEKLPKSGRHVPFEISIRDTFYRLSLSTLSVKE